MRSIEPHNKKQNKGERIIGELRRRWRDKRRKKNIPSRLWDYVLVWCVEIYSRTYNHKTQRTRLEHFTGDTPDISEWLDFDIYDQVWFWDSPGKEENPRPGRWLGVSHRIGSRTTVQHVTSQDLRSEDIRHQFELLHQRLNQRLDDQNFISPDAPNMLYEEDLEPDYIDNPRPYDPDAMAGDVEEDTNVFDEYLGAECCWTNDTTLCTRQVTRFIVVYANLYEIMAVPHYVCMAVAICPLGCDCTPGRAW